MLQDKAKKVYKAKILKGDEIIVIAGKSKGQTGRVAAVYPRDERVLIDGVNLVTKAVRPNPQLNIQGGLEKREAPLHISNVAILNPKTQKADRVGYSVAKDGAKVRVFRSSGEVIPNVAKDSE
ncbi:MAG: 50S ribosomal protein L24 [Gammaproteobacteria bacterium]